MGETTLDEDQGVDQALLILFWQQVLELEEEIAELVLQWQSACRVEVPKTQVAQDAWVAHLHRTPGGLLRVAHLAPFGELFANVPPIVLPGR